MLCLLGQMDFVRDLLRIANIHASVLYFQHLFNFSLITEMKGTQRYYIVTTPWWGMIWKSSRQMQILQKQRRTRDTSGMNLQQANHDSKISEMLRVCNTCQHYKCCIINICWADAEISGPGYHACKISSMKYHWEKQELFLFLCVFWGLCGCYMLTQHKTNTSTKWVISIFATMEPILPVVRPYQSSLWVCMCVFVRVCGEFSFNSNHSCASGI